MRKTMSVIFRIICVRHGETEANKVMKIQGHLDVPLSNVGEVQAAAAGVYLSSVSVTRAYSSDLLRAKTTCEIILEKNGFPKDKLKTDVRIRERNFGCVEGHYINEVLEMAKEEGKSWPSYTPPGGETLGQLHERIVSFYKDLCQSMYDCAKRKNTLSCESDTEEQLNLSNSEIVLVVSHGAALRELYTHFEKNLNCEDIPETESIAKITPNTGISEFVVKFSPRKYHMRCIRLNDASHLESLKD
ncbi:UNVERIFIED_CONTAM: hypothetical protein RMT77_010435 [Armadillidium vulgare]|nr:Fructose-2,6-bisphosphatase TIGAR [Armadillidium vulgare]